MAGGWGIAKEVFREDDSVKSTIAVEEAFVDGPTPALVLVANETLRCRPGEDDEGEDDGSLVTATVAGAPSSSVSLFASLSRSCGEEERGSGLNV